MTPHRSRCALGFGVVAIALAACGTPSPDLFVVERTGAVPGAKLDLRVQDGGEVTCNGKSAGMMSSDQLITARELIRELSGGKVDRQNDQTSDSGPLDRDLVLPPGPRSILRFELRAEEGTIAFSDSSAKQPEGFFKVTRLVRDLAKSVCKLPR
ncbi:hypothetical protein DSM112329_03997 [Paraconexibacter sp. AEG42_29]|uniref:Lipoprotein n=1 Tax=Paraconexibacter sp. AEG42_29 TaxID=2997339 RepID=A0AAU7AZI5_9ACTN